MKFTTDNLPPQFGAVLDQNEKILWVGNPTLVPFLLSGVPLLILGLVWGSFDYFGLIRHMDKMRGEAAGFMIPFFALHLFPLWLGVGNMIRLFLVFWNTCYAFTNKRVMIRSGFFGIGFKSIDFDRIQEMDVTVNPIENILGVGSIKMFSGATGNNGVRSFDFFMGIENPYQVYKQLKTVSVDVKTDWNYPNALRPGENKGYKTEYTPNDTPPL